VALFARFFGRTVSEGAAFAIGTATAPALRPILQDLSNAAWETHPARPIDAATLALGVSQRQIPHDWAVDEAARTGVNGERFGRMVDAANVGPGAAYAFELWRRDLLTEAAFRRALGRLGIEAEWIDDLVALKNVLLSPSELANARQQGFIDVARQHAEAELQGITSERADIQFELSGLPLGVGTMQEAANRELVDRATFDQAIREGHTKTKYTELAWRLRRPVLTAQEYASARLRNWISAEESYAGGELTGHTREQMDLLFLNRGRPASPTQMWRAWARKIIGPRGVPTSFEDHAKAIAISDIRPEYADLLWGIRFNYPPLFQLNRLVTAGAITTTTAADWAHKNLVAPEVIDALKTYWDTLGGTTADKHVGRAETQLWTRTHAAFVAFDIDVATAEAQLTTLGVPADSQARILALWSSERELPRKQLTRTDIRKQYRELTLTREQAVEQIMQLGYTEDAANSYLDE
jgi:hypothetical protein